MKSNISIVVRMFTLGLMLGILFCFSGCLQGQAKGADEQPATGGSGAAPVQRGEQEDQMQRESTGIIDDVAEPLGEDGWVTGSEEYTKLAALDISISNGTLTVKRGEVAPDEVRLCWTIKPGRGLKAADPRDVVINQRVAAGLLEVKDEYKGPKYMSGPSVHVVATVGAGIAAAASLGNGDLELDCARIKAADCGNGNVNLTGELIDDADVSLGNGKLVAVLLVAGGQHELNTGNGEINLTARAGSNFTFTADTGVGKVNLSGAGVRETGRDWGLVGGEVRGAVGSGGGSIGISVGNGTVSVTGE